MKKTLGIMFLSALLIAGCGKKKEPEDSTGPAITTETVRVVLVRGQVKGPTDAVAFRGVISITNNRSVEITLTKADFSAWIAGAQMGTDSRELGFTLAPGSTTELTLDTTINWPAEKDINANRGKVMGTLSYRTPNGMVHELPFEHGGELTIKGE